MPPFLVRSLIGFVLSYGFLLPSPAKAQQTGLDQSSPGLDWQVIGNDFVDVIYPAEAKAQAVYMANLFEHYSQVVGMNYGIEKPKKVTLVYRIERAEPNGFVTLAPRRTEFYSSSSYTPLIGSLDWTQILSIHEYRHVNQFDYFNRNTVRYFDYAMGDMGIQLAHFFSLHSWFMEGDAVWSETKYTDGGRGRSPRFLARMKAILLKGEVPTYDQFVNGTYRDALVDQYVYGFLLIANGYKKFGTDFWPKVIDKTTVFPHPYRFLSSFQAVSGQSFAAFYQETFHELRKSWQKDSFPELKPTDYQKDFMPGFVDGKLYFLRSDLDNQTAIYLRGSNGDEKIAEVPSLGDLSQVDYHGDKAIYVTYKDDGRYHYKGTSPLYLIDLKTGSKSVVLEDGRYYSPKLSPDGQKILAVEFTKDLNWKLIETDLNGQKLREIGVPEKSIVEVEHLNASTAIAILNGLDGKKSIVTIDLETKAVQEKLPATRNTLYGIHSDGRDSVYFEAQSKGYTEIFKLSLTSGQTAKCTTSRISAYSPFLAEGKLYYSDVTPNGQRILDSSEASCAAFPKAELLDYQYLGTTNSDDYAKVPVVEFKDQPAYHQRNADRYLSRPYSRLESRTFIPHSWNFIGGRGLALTLRADNYIGDIETNVYLGSDAEENTPYASALVSYKRYFPIFTLGVNARNRSIEVPDSDVENEWREQGLVLNIALPYMTKDYLINKFATLAVQAEGMRLSSFETQLGDISTDYYDTEDLTITTAVLNLGIYKDLTYRSLLSPWSIGGTLQYEDANSSSEEALNSYRFYSNAKVTNPGLWGHHVMLWEFSTSQTNSDPFAYKFSSVDTDPTDYTFSRGYDFFEVDSYEKSSVNYHFPLAYPDFALWGTFYAKRISGNLFYDHTIASAGTKDYVLDSEGVEILVESVLFRRLPLDFGARYTYRLAEKNTLANFFLGTSLSLF